MVLESSLSMERLSNFFPWRFKTGLDKALLSLVLLALLCTVGWTR